MLWPGCGAVEGSGKVKKKQRKVAVWFEVSSMEMPMLRFVPVLSWKFITHVQTGWT